MAEDTMAGNTRPPPARRPRRRALARLAWWALMMALWVMIDDSVRFDELLAGAGAAALAALAAETATCQASVRIRQRQGNRSGNRQGDTAGTPLAAELARLPGQVARDTLTVLRALAETLVTGRLPAGGFAEVPVDVPPAEAGRVLLTGVRSLAPNTFAVGVDDERGVMVVHRLVPPDRRATGSPATGSPAGESR